MVLDMGGVFALRDRTIISTRGIDSKRAKEPTAYKRRQSTKFATAKEEPTGRHCSDPRRKECDRHI
jgi:hypothetical protein